MGEARRPDKTTAEIASEDIEKLATRSVRASTVSGEPDVEQAGSTTSAAQIPKEDLRRPTTKIHKDELLGLLGSDPPSVVPVEAAASNAHVIPRDESEVATVDFAKVDKPPEIVPDSAPAPEKLEEIAKLVGAQDDVVALEDRDRKTEIMVANDFKMMLRHGAAEAAAGVAPASPVERLPRASTVSYDEADDKEVASRRARPAPETDLDLAPPAALRPAPHTLEVTPEMLEDARTARTAPPQTIELTPERVAEITLEERLARLEAMGKPEQPRRPSLHRYERFDSEPSVPKRTDLGLMIGAVLFILALVAVIATLASI
jgi:hypothetical protein